MLYVYLFCQLLFLVALHLGEEHAVYERLGRMVAEMNVALARLETLTWRRKNRHA